jgi:Zn-finger nucleic acid-binding protein
MKTVDKAGVHIDQCEGCRGIFLDRGELEQIAGAEGAYYSNQAAPPYREDVRYSRPDSPHPYRGGHGDSPKPYRGGHGDSPHPYRGGHGDSPKPYRGGHGYADSPGPYRHGGQRKRSFLENLFD